MQQKKSPTVGRDCRAKGSLGFSFRRVEHEELLCGSYLTCLVRYVKQKNKLTKKPPGEVSGADEFCGELLLKYLP